MYKISTPFQKEFFTNLVEDSSGLTQERILEVFSYDSENAVLVRNKSTGAGSKLGKKDSRTGVIRVGLDGQIYTAHYLIWRIVYSREPVSGVFHINWNQSDNRIENLCENKRALNPKHIEESIGSGFTLLNDEPLIRDGVPDFNYKTYSCNACDFEQFLQPTHIRRKNCKCAKCDDELLVTRAAERGFTLVGDHPDISFKVYRRNQCGHVFPIRHSSMIKRVGTHSSHTCNECYEQKLKVEAEKLDMTYSGSALTKKSIFRRYRFDVCGHERDVNAVCVGRGNVQCQDCELDKRKNEATEVGLVYLDNQGEKVNGMTKHRYILPCGCVKSLRIDHAKRNSWQCNNCEDTHYIKPSKVYLLHFNSAEFSWLKLGYAKDIKARATGYGTASTPYELLFERDFDTGLEALHYEQSIHQFFKSDKLNKKEMKKFQKFNGHTECYPLSVLDTMLKKLNDDKLTNTKVATL